MHRGTSCTKKRDLRKRTGFEPVFSQFKKKAPGFAIRFQNSRKRWTHWTFGFSQNKGNTDRPDSIFVQEKRLCTSYPLRRIEQLVRYK